MEKKNQEVVPQDLYEDGEIFLTKLDHENFKEVFSAICNESGSVAVISKVPALIDHYGQLLIGRLRRKKSMRIEIYFPANTDTLINRFNQILSNLSVDQATGKMVNSEPDRVMVVHDFSAMNDRELQLMARITNDFPGAKTRVVLLLDLSVTQSSLSRLDTFGKNLKKWHILEPDNNSIAELKKLSKKMNFGDRADSLLKKLGQEKVQESTTEDRGSSNYQVDDDPKQIENGDQNIDRNNRQIDYSPKLIPLLLAVAVISLVVIIFLYKQDISSFITRTFLSNSSVEVNNPPSIELEDIEERATSQIKEPKKRTDELESAKSPLVTSGGDDEREGSATLDQIKSSEPPADPIEVEGSTNFSSKKVLEDFADGDWLLQHIAVDTYGDARDWRELHPVLESALIVPITSGGPETRRYVVVSGPYKSKKEALEFLKVPGVPADYYPRTVRSLKAVIPASLLR